MTVSANRHDQFYYMERPVWDCLWGSVWFGDRAHQPKPDIARKLSNCASRSKYMGSTDAHSDLPSIHHRSKYWMWSESMSRISNMFDMCRRHGGHVMVAAKEYAGRRVDLSGSLSESNRGSCGYPRRFCSGRSSPKDDLFRVKKEREQELSWAQHLISKSAY